MVGGLWRKWRGSSPGPQTDPAEQPAATPGAYPQAPLPAWERPSPPATLPPPPPSASTAETPAPSTPRPDRQPRELVFNGRRYTYAALPEDVRQLVQAITSADERIRHRQGTIEALRVGRRAMAQDLRQRLQPLPQLSDNPVP